MNKTKRCAHCHRWKPLHRFHSSRTMPDGKIIQCIPCKKILHARWAKKNPTYASDYYHANKEKCKADQRKWVDKNREYWNAYNRKYQKEHPEKVKQWRKTAKERQLIEK